ECQITSDFYCLKYRRGARIHYISPFLQIFFCADHRMRSAGSIHRRHPAEALRQFGQSDGYWLPVGVQPEIDHVILLLLYSRIHDSDYLCLPGILPLPRANPVKAHTRKSQGTQRRTAPKDGMALAETDHILEEFQQFPVLFGERPV